MNASFLPVIVCSSVTLDHSHQFVISSQILIHSSFLLSSFFFPFFSVPDAGMFVWFRVQGLGTDAKDLIEKKAVAAKVLMLPGEAFLVEQSKANELFVRASFSVATDEQIENALARFGTLLKEQFAKAAGVV